MKFASNKHCITNLSAYENTVVQKNMKGHTLN